MKHLILALLLSLSAFAAKPIETLTDAEKAAMRSGIDAEESVTASIQLARWRDQINTSTSPVILLNGDSMINQSAGFLGTMIENNLGFSGIAFKAASAEGGAVILNTPSRWFTWDGARLSGSGHIGKAFDGTGVASAAANTLKVYYISQPGGGTFKVQTKKNNGAWADEAAHLAVSSNATLAGNVITITKTDFRALWDIRCVWVSGGSVDVAGFAAYHTNMLGARIANMHASGGSGNMVDWNTMPAAISNPIFADMGIDLVLFSHLDGAAGVTGEQSNWQEKVSRAGAVTISTLTATTTVITVNTSTAHGLSVDEWVRMKGVSVSGYNDRWYAVASITDSDTFTCNYAGDLGAASGGTVGKEPTWVCVGPPMGFDSTEQTARLAQAAAMKSLAATRGDAYWDNNRWAVSPSYGLANGLLLPGDVHYTTIARENWTTKMVNDLGLFHSTDRYVLGESYSTWKGGKIRRFRNANLGAATLEGNEHIGDLRLAPPDGGGAAGGSQNGGVLYLESYTGPATSNDGGQIRYQSDGFSIGPIGVENWGFRQDVGSGASFWCRLSTQASPNGLLGTSTNPFRSLTLAKTIIATGTTGVQTINKAVGSVNLASGDPSKDVINSLAIAPTSLQVGSIITATVRTNDATMKSVIVVCTANGTFTLIPNAAPTNEVRVDFAIITP